MSKKNSRIIQAALWAVCSVTLSGQQYSISTIAGGVPPATPAVARNASISPEQVATDSNGNVFFSSNNAVFEIDSTGLLTRIAGNSRAGASGDGGSALDAQFNRPGGIAVDKDGNVFIADSGNQRVRRVSVQGIITTVAGIGVRGYSGDGGPGSAAQLFFPTDVAVDGTGNLFIADDFRVRRVSAAGVITTIAGNGSNGYSGDGGPAGKAQLNANAVTLDNAGNLYVADTANYRIRKIGLDGTITTVAGNGTFGSSGDGGAAINAQLWNPMGVAVDAKGNIYIADSNNNCVRMVSTNGTITTVAGISYGFSGDGGPAINAGLAQPVSVAVSHSGDFYIVDSLNYRIRHISTSLVITTLAGNGFANYSGDGGPASNSQLSNPNGVAVDAAGNIYIVDTNNSRIRKIDTHSVLTTVAGNGISGYSGDHGPAIDAQLSAPNGVAVDQAGNLYIADTSNSVIRKVTPGGVITTIAGVPGAEGFAGDGGPALQSQLALPQGVATDTAGNIYIADTRNNRIRKVSSSGVITTIAGSSGGFLGDGNPATSAALNYPWSVAVDAAGNVLIADLYDMRIRKVSPSGIITTIAGNGTSSVNSGDCGPGTSATVGESVGVAVDAAGNVYFSSNFVIRKVSPSGIIRTIAGNDAIFRLDGYVGDGGPALSAGFFPLGLTVDAAGNIYIADGSNNAIRMLTQTSATSGLFVANAASFQPGGVAPGEIIVLYGCAIGPAQLVVATQNAAGFLNVQLGGTSVSINGIPAPIVYASATQTAVIVPYEIAGGQVAIAATYQGVTSSQNVPVAATSPALFTQNASGVGQAAAVNSDGSLNSVASPAKIGDFIVLFATGEGQTNPPGVDGKPASPPLPAPILPVSAMIGGKPAEVLYAGGAPGETAGVMQLNLVIPNGIQPGTQVPIVIAVGNTQSPLGVTISVR